MKHRGYEILQFSLCEGWVNNLCDGNDELFFFARLEDALTELQEEFDDWAAEISVGERREDEGFDIGEFHIMCAETDKVYELDLNDGKVIVFADKEILPCNAPNCGGTRLKRNLESPQ